MENNIFEHQFGDGAEDMKLKSFVTDAVPAEADMSSIKKKTYAKIRHDNERRMGLVVDSLLERQEIVIKPLGEYLGDLKGISGATILGDGSVILILDPHEIYLMATSKAL